MDFYLVLLQVGFALPLPLPSPRCALTAPFHPYPLSLSNRNRSGGIFSVALSVGSHRPGVTWHPALGARTFLPTDCQQNLPTILSSDCPTNSFHYLEHCTSTHHQWICRLSDPETNESSVPQCMNNRLIRKNSVVTFEYHGLPGSLAFAQDRED